MTVLLIVMVAFCNLVSSVGWRHVGSLRERHGASRSDKDSLALGVAMFFGLAGLFAAFRLGQMVPA